MTSILFTFNLSSVSVSEQKHIHGRTSQARLVQRGADVPLQINGLAVLICSGESWTGPVESEAWCKSRNLEKNSASSFVNTFTFV